MAKTETPTAPAEKPKENFADRGRSEPKPTLVLSQLPESVQKRLKEEAPANALFADRRDGVDGWRLKDGGFKALGKPKAV